MNMSDILRSIAMLHATAAVSRLAVAKLQPTHAPDHEKAATQHTAAADACEAAAVDYDDLDIEGGDAEDADDPDPAAGEG